MYSIDLSEEAMQFFEAASAKLQECLDRAFEPIREEDQGGLSLPPKLVAAAASGELSIQISILVMLDDYVEPEQESSLSNTAENNAGRIK